MTTNESFASSPAGQAMAKLMSSTELLMDAALRVNRTQLTEAEARRYSEAEMRQMNGGFKALLLEAIGGSSDQVRTMIVDTMIPGLVLKGETVDGIVRWTSGFMVAIACETLAALPPELHAPAGDWLCRFSADYIRDVARSAAEAAASEA